jgi:hypothetical protein
MTRLAGGKTAEDILVYLNGVHFPARKDEIVHAARKNQAPNDIVGALGQLPANEFQNAEELLVAYPRLD